MFLMKVVVHFIQSIITNDKSLDRKKTGLSVVCCYCHYLLFVAGGDDREGMQSGGGGCTGGDDREGMQSGGDDVAIVITCCYCLHLLLL